MDLTGKIRAIADPSFVEQVGIRYLNLLREIDGLEPRQLVAEGLRGLSPVGLGVRTSQIQSMTRCQTDIGVLTIRCLDMIGPDFLPPDLQIQGMKFPNAPNEQEAFCLLDIDNTTDSAEAIDFNDLENVLWSLHQYTSARISTFRGDGRSRPLEESPMTATIERRNAKMALAIMVPATGLGVTFPCQAETTQSEECATWDTLDSPAWNALARLHRVRETNLHNRIYSDLGFYLTGGTGSGEPAEFVVTEAESNRFSKAVRLAKEAGLDALGRMGDASDLGPQYLTDVPAIVAHIRTELSLSITDLATMLDVQRPTIYAWLRGDSQPQQRNIDRLKFLYRVSNRWAKLAGRPLGRQLRHAFGENGKSLFELLKDEAPDFEEIANHLAALAKLPPPKRLSSMKELAEKHGLRTEPHQDAELVRDIESGQRLTDD